MDEKKQRKKEEKMFHVYCDALKNSLTSQEKDLFTPEKVRLGGVFKKQRRHSLELNETNKTRSNLSNLIIVLGYWNENPESEFSFQ